MKYCRLTQHNQVAEIVPIEQLQVYQDFFGIQIIECPPTVQPLMWYIEGQWLQESEYQIHIPSPPMTVDQLVDLLKWNGIEVYPL